jgi:hypothetical protein
MRRILLVAAALMACTTLFAGAALAKTFVCKAVPCLGTAQDDQITERAGSVRDVIRAGDGDDLLDASPAGKDRDGLHGDGGSDTLNVVDGDFRDSAICGPGPNDSARIDASFNFETGVLKLDGTSGCESILLIGPDFNNPAANGGPTQEEAVAASEAKVE